MERNINSLNEKSKTGSNAFQNAMMAYYKYKQGQPEVAPTDQQYQNSTNSLREAAQYAENRGINTALRLMDDPDFRGRDNSGLINSAQNAFRPGILSADKQLAQLADIKNQENEKARLAETIRSNKATESISRNSDNSTQTERYNTILGSYVNGFESGGMMEDGYTPIKAPSGYLTLAAWKSAIADARKKGIDRIDFIREYGGYLNPNMYKDYGLVPSEISILTNTGKVSSNNGIENPFE